MSSTAAAAIAVSGNPQSLLPPPPPPPADVHQSSTVSINDHKNDEIDGNQVDTNVIEEDLDDMSTDSSLNSGTAVNDGDNGGDIDETTEVKSTKIDLLGLGNSDTAVNDGHNGGVTDATTVGKPKKSVITTKIDLLGLGNSDPAINDGDTDATTEVKPKKSVITTKIDLLGFGNSDPAVIDGYNGGDNGGVTDETTEVKSKKSTITTKIDLLGFGNSDPAVNDGAHGGVTEATTEVKPKKPIQISPDRMKGGESYRYEEVYDFPPDLNRNGRQRFDLVTVRENGRLQIFMVPNRWPLLVRSPLRDGRLRMWLLDDDQRGGDTPAPPYHGGQIDRKVD